LCFELTFLNAFYLIESNIHDAPKFKRYGITEYGYVKGMSHMWLIISIGYQSQSSYKISVSVKSTQNAFVYLVLSTSWFSENSWINYK